MRYYKRHIEVMGFHFISAVVIGSCCFLRWLECWIFCKTTWTIEVKYVCSWSSCLVIMAFDSYRDDVATDPCMTEMGRNTGDLFLVDRRRFLNDFCLLLWPWASLFSSLCLIIAICENGIINQGVLRFNEIMYQRALNPWMKDKWRSNPLPHSRIFFAIWSG